MMVYLFSLLDNQRLRVIIKYKQLNVSYYQLQFKIFMYYFKC